MVEDFLEDAVSKDIILEKGEAYVDFLCEEGGMGDVCGMKQDPLCLLLLARFAFSFVLFGKKLSSKPLGSTQVSQQHI